MVTVHVTTVNFIVNFNTKDCPKLNMNYFFWIGMHDSNHNGEHKWASGNFPLPFPLQWYRGRPAKTGELRELVFFHGLHEKPSLVNVIQFHFCKNNQPTSGECVYLDLEGKWKGEDCRETEVRSYGLYALCKRPGKLVEGTTENPQETTGGVGIFTHGKNETMEASDEDERFFLTDEVLISLALMQLPAVILAFLGITKAFHKHGCTRQAPLQVFKASLLVFIPFCAIEVVGAVFEVLGLCLALIPCSRMIRKIHQVQTHSKPLH